MVCLLTLFRADSEKLLCDKIENGRAWEAHYNFLEAAERRLDEADRRLERHLEEAERRWNGSGASLHASATPPRHALPRLGDQGVRLSILSPLESASQ